MRSLAVLLLALLFSQVSFAKEAVNRAAPGQEMDGKVVIEVHDYENKPAQMRYILSRPGKPLLDFQPGKRIAKQLKTGQSVRIRGASNGKTVDATADGAVTILSEPVVAAAAAAQIRKVLVIIVDVVDANGLKHAVPSNCSTIAADQMFGTSGGLNADGCYAEASYNNLGIGGAGYPGRSSDVVRVSVVDTVTSANWATSCNFSAWQDKADVAVGSSRLGAYQHHFYLLPPGAGCGFVGIGLLGCDNYPGFPCRAAAVANQINTCGYKDAYTHEIGHNLGLAHADVDDNNDGVADCYYCDSIGFMGFSIDQHRSLNAAHIAQMGWLNGRMVDGSQGGTFTISAQELTSAPYPQAVKIIPQTTLRGSSPYFLSMRAPIGYDKSLAMMSSDFLYKTHIHRHNGQISDTMAIGYPLGDGQVFVDPDNKITITQLSHTAQTVTVRVDVQSVEPVVPVLSIDNVEQPEGAGNMVFTARLSETTSRDVSFSIGTSNGTALPGSDYEERSWSNQVIPAGQTTATFMVPIVNDTDVEMNEKFSLNLNDVVGAKIPNPQGFGTVLNDDQPTMTISSGTTTEVDAGGFSTLTFVIKLSEPSPTPTYYNAQTVSGSAMAGVDYEALSTANLYIDAGRTSRQFGVRVYGDVLAENTETVSVKLSGVVGAKLGTDTATGTIVDNDGAPAVDLAAMAAQIQVAPIQSKPRAASTTAWGKVRRWLLRPLF